MWDANRVEIIGIGDDGLAGLSSLGAERINAAEVLIGPPSLLNLVARTGVERISTGPQPQSIVDAILSREGKRRVVLSGGDPLFYGVARFLCQHLGKERFNVVPHVSSMQLAFARVKESWDEAYLANLESVPLDRALAGVRACEKAGLFTTSSVTPAVVAQACLDRGLNFFHAFVCENLGSPDERVTRSELPQLVNESFSLMNVLILVRRSGVPHDMDRSSAGRLIGNPDEYFEQSLPRRQLLTPMELRALAIALLDLRQDAIVWDVGAGSGSVSIEVARLAPSGTVYAIEMDPASHGMIESNATRMGATNVIAVLGQAPEVWKNLPDPHAIFIGGTGRRVANLAVAAWSRLSAGGHLVVHVNSLQNLVETEEALRHSGGQPTSRMIQISYGIEQLDSTRWESRHPTFLVHVPR
jgi:precorrin-6Y C5,15-methyltransferase (decarboxylating)